MTLTYSTNTCQQMAEQIFDWTHMAMSFFPRPGATRCIRYGFYHQSNLKKAYVLQVYIYVCKTGSQIQKAASKETCLDKKSSFKASP